MTIRVWLWLIRILIFYHEWMYVHHAAKSPKRQSHGSGLDPIYSSIVIQFTVVTQSHLQLESPNPTLNTLLFTHILLAITYFIVSDPSTLKSSRPHPHTQSFGSTYDQKSQNWVPRSFLCASSHKIPLHQYTSMSQRKIVDNYNHKPT